MFLHTVLHKSRYAAPVTVFSKNYGMHTTLRTTYYVFTQQASIVCSPMLGDLYIRYVIVLGPRQKDDTERLFAGFLLTIPLRAAVCMQRDFLHFSFDCTCFRFTNSAKCNVAESLVLNKNFKCKLMFYLI